MKFVLICVCSIAIVAVAAVQVMNVRTADSMSKETAESLLPARAIIKEDLGRGWFKVDLDNKLYIYRYMKKGVGRTEILTPCE